MELGYRNVDVDSINKNGTARANAEGNADIYTAMLNGTYDVDLDVPVVPYISVGVGALGASGHTKFTRTSGTPQGNNADGITFAGQLGLGLGYEVAPGVSLLGGYSVLAAPTEQIGTNEVILIHNAQVGLNYQF